MTVSVVKTKLFPDPHQDLFSNTILGFWIYLMSDCIIFATLFTTYAVLHNNTFGNATPQELFTLSLPFAETLILLVSSITCGFGMLAACRSAKKTIIFWLALTLLLGLSFVILEVSEFKAFVQEGHGWDKSAFLSSFFTLVGTHGLHVSIGLLWMIVIMAQMMIYGVTVTTFRRIACFTLFWHFLDLVWIFIFTFVYLMGVL
jgi:cytochrome o ubiquinol oxidase subunit 3